MKAKRSKPAASGKDSELKDAVAPYVVPAPESSMIRTQIYLTPAEYHFLQAESQRRKEPMAAVIRSIVDDKMELPDDAWTNNPMLRPTPKDPTFDLPEDAAINHDHYLYGTPKRYVKVKGQWVLAEETRR
jgi:hypothetical protein